MNAARLTAGDKAVMGVREIFTLVNLGGVLLSAGYSQLTNGQPNYGDRTDGRAFAQQVGASAARSASESLFTISVLSPVFHQDPRYYVKGQEHSFGSRVVYAATRPLIGRTDGGRTTINAALLIGYAGAAALTRTYYPPINRNFHDVAATFGGSLGGAAIGFEFSEFSDQILQAVHLRKK